MDSLLININSIYQKTYYEANHINILVFSLLSIFSWTLIYFVGFQISQSIMNYYFKQKWISISNNEKYHYFSAHFSNFHAYTSFLGSLIGLFWSCQNPSDNFFSSAECRENPSNLQQFLNFYSFGYLLIDLYGNIYKVKYTSKLGAQYHFHHIINMIGLFAGYLIGGSAMTISQVSTFTEMSNPFINGRQILTFHGYDAHIISLLNGIMIFATFLVSRILFQGFIVYYLIFPQYLLNKQVPFVYHLVGLAYISFYALNWLWFLKIIRLLFRKIISQFKRKSD